MQIDNLELAQVEAVQDGSGGLEVEIRGLVKRFGCGSFEPRFLGDHAANLMSSFWGADT